MKLENLNLYQNKYYDRITHVWRNRRTGQVITDFENIPMLYSEIQHHKEVAERENARWPRVNTNI